MVVKEIILENFMSYLYARVPLKPGLNIICGPNGAGKSSILLALAVALGQTYTERSRRLCDLIRRGKDLARVSVVFDNSPRDGGRPIPSVGSDTVVLSRYLRRDGTYWHEINSKVVTKGEVLRLLSRLSINPDNMLIIMHQHMVDLFSAVDPRERLRMVEEASGLADYRERIVEAREKLSHTLSEEDSIRRMLEKALETLRYWEGEYQRLKHKRELTERRRKLEVEYAWSKCIKQEDLVRRLLSRLEELERELLEIGGELERSLSAERDMEVKLKELEFELDGAYQRLIEAEKASARAESKLELLEDLYKSLHEISAQAGFAELLGHLKAELDLVRGRLGGMSDSGEAKSNIVKLKDERERGQEAYIGSRVRTAGLGFKRELVERDISRLRAELRRAREELEELEGEARRIGPRLETEREPQEILDELRITNAQLAGLADVSEDVERMYLSYRDMLSELERKAEIAAENRRRALEELELRKERWKQELNKMLKGVREAYGRILGRVNASGDVGLVNAHDIDEAGLEISVGFLGSEPQVLDAHIQSGGERTTASMCFLLALQQSVRSPIRAVDEFDIHMDPRNRGAMMTEALELMKGAGTQYIMITPGQLARIEDVPNIIVVQNVAGTSSVRVAA